MPPCTSCVNAGNPKLRPPIGLRRTESISVELQTQRFQTRFWRWGRRLLTGPHGSTAVVVRKQRGWPHVDTMRLRQTTSWCSRLLSLPAQCCARHMARYACSKSCSWIQSVAAEFTVVVMVFGRGRATNTCVRNFVSYGCVCFHVVTGDCCSLCEVAKCFRSGCVPTDHVDLIPCRNVGEMDVTRIRPACASSRSSA